MRKRPLTYEEFKNIYSKVKRLVVELVIKDQAGILLTLRAKNGYVGLWHLPGGTVMYKEPVKQAVSRIAEEELGIQINIDKFLGYIEYPNEEKEKGFGYPVALVFLCQAKSKNFVLDEDAEKVDFFKEFPKNSIPEQKAFVEELKYIR